MGLTQKILLFTGALVIALVATTLAFTTVQADRLAHRTINQGLSDTRGVWETFQADRYAKLKLGIRVLGNDPYFKAAVETNDQATILDTLKERNLELKAGFFIATDPAGIVIARTDRPSAQGEDLSSDPLITASMQGEESATIWRQEDKLYHAVSVPMQTGPDLKGVLIAGYRIDESVASHIHRITQSEIAYLTQEPGRPPRLSVSSLGPEEPALANVLSRPEFSTPEAGAQPFPIDLGGEPHVAVVTPLKAASGETLGSVVALRSLAVEMASFVQFRNSLVLVSLVVMILGLALAYLAARGITGPVRKLVRLVERARDGSYSGAVSVATSDEIGVLARTFNGLLTDLRQKEQMIGFLREGMTMLRKGASPAVTASPSGISNAPTAVISGTAGPTGPRLEKGTLFGGRYEVHELLGKGGMGVVYRAKDRQLDDVVALKILRPDMIGLDPTLLDRFKQEIRLARKITHRNVLRTHDFGEADGTPYISMEYVEGVTLKDLILNKGALPLGVGLGIAKQMCQGLDAAHRQGVIHRDIKPQNMLILPETGELKIMDFGIARVSEVKGRPDAGLTTTGTVMGTPDYMAPEQAQGRPTDFRSDIYSLGVVLFEVFSGKLPFMGNNVMTIVLAHIQQPPPRPRSVNPRLPDGLEAVILRCMAKQPGGRYARVTDILKDLTAVSAEVDSGTTAA